MARVLVLFLCLTGTASQNVADEQPRIQFCHNVPDGDCKTCIKTKTLEPLPANCGYCANSGKCWDAQHLDSTCTINCVGIFIDYPNCRRHTCPAPGPSPPPGPAPPAGKGP